VSSKSKIRFLDFDELDELLSQPMNNRDDLMICLLYETGCTVAELVGICFRHIDLNSNKLTIASEHARNKELRRVFISDKLIKKIRIYRKNNPDGKYLFSSRQSETITTKRVRQLVQKNLKSIGITKAGPQILRYTHIVHAYQKNIPLTAIQKQVGLKRSRAIEIFQQLPELETEGAYKRFMR